MVKNSSVQAERVPAGYGGRMVRGWGEGALVGAVMAAMGAAAGRRRIHVPGQMLFVC